LGHGVHFKMSCSVVTVGVGVVSLVFGRRLALVGHHSTALDKWLLLRHHNNITHSTVAVYGAVISRSSFSRCRFFAFSREKTYNAYKTQRQRQKNCLRCRTMYTVSIFFYLYSVYACILTYCINCCFCIVLVYCTVTNLVLWLQQTNNVHLGFTWALWFEGFLSVTVESEPPEQIRVDNKAIVDVRLRADPVLSLLSHS